MVVGYLEGRRRHRGKLVSQDSSQSCGIMATRGRERGRMERTFSRLTAYSIERQRKGERESSRGKQASPASLGFPSSNQATWLFYASLHSALAAQQPQHRCRPLHARPDTNNCATRLTDPIHPDSTRFHPLVGD